MKHVAWVFCGFQTHSDRCGFGTETMRRGCVERVRFRNLRERARFLTFLRVRLKFCRCGRDRTKFFNQRRTSSTVVYIHIFYKRSKLARKTVDVWRSKAGLGNLRPAWTFDTARIRIFVTQVRVQHRVKTKLHDKQVLSKSREVILHHR